MASSLTRLSLAASLAPGSLAWTSPSLGSLLELFPPWLLAVPKKKVSHSRKNMRSANKGLKDKHNIVNCPGCGAAKLSHHLGCSVDGGSEPNAGMILHIRTHSRHSLVPRICFAVTPCI
ncbi:unnamed protein product [Peniophora sp. CBMAI 1063]|nr:unnamed protein product [Peniophora sp. CBMAI 1063]